MDTMTPGEIFRLILMSALVTIFVYFRCRSIFKEKAQPSQDGVTTEQCQKGALNTPEEDSDYPLYGF